MEWSLLPGVAETGPRRRGGKPLQRPLVRLSVTTIESLRYKHLYCNLGAGLFNGPHVPGSPGSDFCFLGWQLPGSPGSDFCFLGW